MAYRRQQYRQQEESIYDLIPAPQAPVQAKTMYKSMYPSTTPATASTFGRSTASTSMITNLAGDYEDAPKNHRWKEGGASFGKSVEHYADTTNFMKKQTKKALPEPEKFSYKVTRKPPVVKADDKPVMGRRSGTDFIKDNVVTNIMAVPGKQAVPDSDYLSKKDYGKVPKYLSKVKKDVCAEREYIQECLYAEQQMYQHGQPQMQLMEESERFKLLAQLKKKWEIVNNHYQNATHVVTLDTVGKVRRKEEFESQLSQLEKAIEKMSKKHVFVQVGHDYDQYNY